MQNKNWIKIHQKLSFIKWLDENICEIENIRNFKYDKNKENTEDNPEELNYETETYDLKNLKKAWFIENKWSELPFHSHIMISFKFENDRFITFALEVRKNSHEVFELYKVFWKSYNVFYVVAKEEDVLYLRTNIRKEDEGELNIFEINLNKDQTENLFKVICDDVNFSFENNIIYKVFTTDCVSGMLNNFVNAKIKIKKYFWDFSPIKVMWRNNLIKGNFKNLKQVVKETLVNPKDQKIKNLKQDKNYSLEIRKNLL
jgi:hypothetical protein